MSANSDLYNRSIQHLINLEKSKDTLTSTVTRELNAHHRRLNRIIGRSGRLTNRRVVALIRRETINTFRTLSDMVESRVSGLVDNEINFQTRSLQMPLQGIKKVRKPTSRTVVNSLTTGSFINNPSLRADRGFRDFFTRVGATELRTVENTVRASLIQGLEPDEIIRRVQLAPNGLIATRAQSNTLVRTITNNMNNNTQAELIRNNEDLLQGYIYVATLDTRTSDICKRYDGRMFPTTSSIRPSLHFNCRSTIIPQVKSYRDLGIRGLRGTAGRRASLNGQIATPMRYSDWLRTQAPGVQNTILGSVAKGEIFRSGRLVFTRFINTDGTPVSLARLQRLDSEILDRYGDTYIPAGNITEGALKQRHNFYDLSDLDPRNTTQLHRQLNDSFQDTLNFLQYNSSIYRNTQLSRVSFTDNYLASKRLNRPNPDVREQGLRLQFYNEYHQRLLRRINISSMGLRARRAATQIDIDPNLEVEDFIRREGQLVAVRRRPNAPAFRNPEQGITPEQATFLVRLDRALQTRVDGVQRTYIIERMFEAFRRNRYDQFFERTGEANVSRFLTSLFNPGGITNADTRFGELVTLFRNRQLRGQPATRFTVKPRTELRDVLKPGALNRIRSDIRNTNRIINRKIERVLPDFDAVTEGFSLAENRRTLQTTFRLLQEDIDGSDLLQISQTLGERLGVVGIQAQTDRGIEVLRGLQRVSRGNIVQTGIAYRRVASTSRFQTLNINDVDVQAGTSLRRRLTLLERLPIARNIGNTTRIRRYNRGDDDVFDTRPLNRPRVPQTATQQTADTLNAASENSVSVIDRTSVNFWNNAYRDRQPQLLSNTVNKRGSTFERELTTARALVDEPELRFTYFTESRGGPQGSRIHIRQGILNHNGTPHAKSFVRFRDTEAIGDEGLNQLNQKLGSLVDNPFDELKDRTSFNRQLIAERQADEIIRIGEAYNRGDVNTVFNNNLFRTVKSSDQPEFLQLAGERALIQRHINSNRRRFDNRTDQQISADYESNVVIKWDASSSNYQEIGSITGSPELVRSSNVLTGQRLINKPRRELLNEIKNGKFGRELQVGGFTDSQIEDLIKQPDLVNVYNAGQATQTREIRNFVADLRLDNDTAELAQKLQDLFDKPGFSSTAFVSEIAEAQARLFPDIRGFQLITRALSRAQGNKPSLFYVGNQRIETIKHTVTSNDVRLSSNGITTRNRIDSYDQENFDIEGQEIASTPNIIHVGGDKVKVERIQLEFNRTNSNIYTNHDEFGVSLGRSAEVKQRIARIHARQYFDSEGNQLNILQDNLDRLQDRFEDGISLAGQRTSFRDARGNLTVGRPITIEYDPRFNSSVQRFVRPQTAAANREILQDWITNGVPLFRIRGGKLSFFTNRDGTIQRVMFDINSDFMRDLFRRLTTANANDINQIN